MFKLCANKNDSHIKHNQQINNQNIDNSKCFGIKFAKIYLNRDIFTCANTFRNDRMWGAVGFLPDFNDISQ